MQTMLLMVGGLLTPLGAKRNEAVTLLILYQGPFLGKTLHEEAIIPLPPRNI